MYNDLKHSCDWISSSVKRYFSIDFEYLTVSMNEKYTSDTLQMTFDLILSLKLQLIINFDSQYHIIEIISRVLQYVQLDMSNWKRTWVVYVEWQALDVVQLYSTDSIWMTSKSSFQIFSIHYRLRLSFLRVYIIFVGDINTRQSPTGLLCDLQTLDRIPSNEDRYDSMSGSVRNWSFSIWK